MINGPFKIGKLGLPFRVKHWALQTLAGKDAVCLNCEIGKDGNGITIRWDQDLYAGTASVYGNGSGAAVYIKGDLDGDRLSGPWGRRVEVGAAK